MMSGFKLELYKILIKFCLRTTGAKGLVLTGGIKTFKFLLNNGFDVEYGEGTLPSYDFIYIPSKRTRAKTLSKALTKLENYGIIVYKDDKNGVVYLQKGQK